MKNRDENKRRGRDEREQNGNRQCRKQRKHFKYVYVINILKGIRETILLIKQQDGI